MLLKLLFVFLILSIIILLYLRLGKRIATTGKWLAIAITIWAIILIIYLPILHLEPLSRFKGFLGISYSIASLVLVHYVGRFMMWAIDHIPLSEEIKRFFDRILSVTFNTLIFALYFLVFLLAFIIGLKTT